MGSVFLSRLLWTVQSDGRPLGPGLSFYDLTFTWPFRIRHTGLGSQQVRVAEGWRSWSLEQKQNTLFFLFPRSLSLISLHWTWIFSEKIIVQISYLMDSSSKLRKMSSRDMLYRSSMGRRVTAPAPGHSQEGVTLFGSLLLLLSLCVPERCLPLSRLEKYLMKESL